MRHCSQRAAVCAIQVGPRQLLASAGDDRTVRLWDPATGAAALLVIPTSAPALAVTQFASGALFIGLSVGVLAVQINAPE